MSHVHAKAIEVVQGWVDGNQEKPLDLEILKDITYGIPETSFSKVLDDSSNSVDVSNTSFCGTPYADLDAGLQGVIEESAAAVLSVLLELKNKGCHGETKEAKNFLHWYSFVHDGLSGEMFLSFSKTGAPTWTIPYSAAKGILDAITFAGVAEKAKEVKLKPLMG